MIRTVLVAASAVTLLGLAACKPSTNTSSIANAIRADETQWNADYAARDASKIAGHYASDAVLMNPGADAVEGQQAAQSAIADALKDPNFTLTFAPNRVDVSSDGDMAYSQGHFTFTQSDPTHHARATQTGSYVTVYKKQSDGSWKSVADIASPGAPMAAMAR